jgi:hypothetical protein
MSSGTSTDRPSARADSGFEVWHYYVLMAMVAATAGVMLSRHTHPAALLLLSAAVVAAGLVGLALHQAMAALVGDEPVAQPVADAERDALEREKALTLRSIKELEFDRAMGKVSAKDFEDVSGRLRARALMIMQELDGLPGPAPGETPETPAGDAAPVDDRPSASAAVCASCGTSNEPDARFCKQCGARL